MQFELQFCFCPLQAVEQALALVTVHRAYDVHAVLGVVDSLLRLEVRCRRAAAGGQGGAGAPPLVCCAWEPGIVLHIWPPTWL